MGLFLLHNNISSLYLLLVSNSIMSKSVIISEILLAFPLLCSPNMAACTLDMIKFKIERDREEGSRQGIMLPIYPFP